MTRLESSQFNMLRIVPPPNHGVQAIVPIAEDAKTGGVEVEISCGSRIEPKPANGENSQQVRT